MKDSSDSKVLLSAALRFFAVIGAAFVILLFFGMFQGPSEEVEYRQEPRALAPSTALLPDALVREQELERQRLEFESKVKLDLLKAFSKFNTTIVGEVNADVQEGKILLHGSINNIRHSIEAANLAESLSRGMPVENNILVKDIDPKWAQ
jgi:hypothetical protein